MVAYMIPRFIVALRHTKLHFSIITRMKCFPEILVISVATTASDLQSGIDPQYDDPQYDVDNSVVKSLRKIDESTMCWCSRGCGVVEPIRLRRNFLKQHICDVPYDPKKPGKGKKDKFSE